MAIRPSSSIVTNESSASGNQGRTDGSAFDRNSGSVRQNGRQRQKLNDPTRDISIQVLEKFSLVTRFARETTSQLFREAHMDGFVAYEGRKHDQSSVDFPQLPAAIESQVPDEVPITPDPLEVMCLFSLSFSLLHKGIFKDTGYSLRIIIIYCLRIVIDFRKAKVLLIL